ncbi:MAG TPA: FxSxx-COOH system tetratricopeptide repeat protein [Ktedonobacteraceae bacterium]|jgi:tetratricopeptide (TPR) repeat protein|nr:FxSxx-COOH system tetratricopeptide repeat protein [Ktedonobacteraceae bacterium]
MSALPEPIEVFFSYANADELLCKELEKHLSLLRRNGLITTWHKRQIIAGTDWARVLDRHLNIASIILLLVSSDFLASDYCYGVEMEQAMKRHDAGEARVIPVILRPCDRKSAPFGKLQALPSNNIPITLWSNQDAAFADVAQGIREALRDIQHLAVSTPSSALPRIWNIPYPRNPVFTGREEILAHLADKLKTGQATALSQPQAISGLGGVGKTQIAIEYAYQHRQDYQVVLWTIADTRESLVSGYITIAELLNLPEKDEQDQTIVVNAVVRWLSTHTEWLLILDNADDPTIVNEFVPPVFGGRILLTTRAQAMGRLASRIEVATMPQDIGALFLLRRALLVTPDATLADALATDAAIAGEICEELGGLPLALDQAGAFIEETQCSLQDYQQRYRTRRTLLLQRRGGLVADHPEPIATTWSLSFEKVEQHSPIAADLLRLCAFLNSDAIPVELVSQGLSHPGSSLAAAAEDDMALDDAMATLGTYSLIRRDREAKTLSIHRLVQAIIQDTMASSERAQWHERVIQALEAIFPEVTSNVWPQCERLLSHVLVAANFSDETESLELGRCLRRAAAYLNGRARYGEAEPLLLRARQIIEQQLAPDPFELVLLFNGLAVLSLRQGKYAQAEPLLLQALQVIENQSGSDHFLEGMTLSNLGLIYFQQGKYVQAEPLFVQALQIIEGQLDSDRSLETVLLSNLGLIYLQQEKDTEAEPLFLRAGQNLDHMEKFGHQDFVLLLGNLGLMYIRQHKYSEAEPLFLRALQIGEQQLGSDHPNIAITLSNLAQLYIRQDKYSEAEPLLLRALQICEQRPDDEPTYVIATLLSLADLYYQQDKYSEAEPLFLRALQIGEQQLGSEHPNIATTLSNLGDVYRMQGKYAEAESVVQRSLQIREQQFGLKHPYVAGALIDIANLYKAQQKYTQAEPLFLQALQIREQWFGPDHLDVAGALIDLANLYKTQKKYTQAEPILQRALQIREQRFGPDHFEVASVLHNLANLYYQQNKYAEAEPLFQQALQIREQQLGPDHLDVATSCIGLALLYEARLKLAKAKQFYQRALQIREQQLGPDHLDVATTLYSLATLYQGPNKYDEADPLLLRALQIRERQLGLEHPSTKEIRKTYESRHKIYRYIYLTTFILCTLLAIACFIFWFLQKFDLLSWIALVIAVFFVRLPLFVAYGFLSERYKNRRSPLPG